MQAEQAQAARAVRRVLDGATLTEALAAVDDGAPGRGRALVQELAYGTLRHWGRLDAIARRLATKPPSDPVLGTLLAVALYQLDHGKSPAFAIVDRAVDAAARVARPAAKAWMNALLRRYLRERAALGTAVAQDPVARWSYPRWWIARLRAERPDDWAAILEAGNERPPLSLRVNRRVTTREALLARFADEGIAADARGAAGIVVAEPRPVAELPGFAEGEFAVQDLGAQLAAPLLDVRDGQRVLDACAAPGGKATHLGELADVRVTALDSDGRRLARVAENVARLRAPADRIDLREGDARMPASWWNGRPYDRILADVPCSASGVVRRHPDIKWLRRADDLAAFARTQAAIADALWPLLARGGLMLYATCSVFGAENEDVVAAFLARHGDALRETISFAPGVLHTGGQLLPSASGAGHNQDGFYYALLRKT